MQLVQTLGQIWQQSVKIHSQLSQRKLPVTDVKLIVFTSSFLREGSKQIFKDLSTVQTNLEFTRGLIHQRKKK